MRFLTLVVCVLYSVPAIAQPLETAICENSHHTYESDWVEMTTPSNRHKIEAASRKAKLESPMDLFLSIGSGDFSCPNSGCAPTRVFCYNNSSSGLRLIQDGYSWSTAFAYTNLAKNFCRQFEVRDRSEGQADSCYQESDVIGGEFILSLSQDEAQRGVRAVTHTVYNDLWDTAERYCRRRGCDVETFQLNYLPRLISLEGVGVLDYLFGSEVEITVHWQGLVNCRPTTDKQSWEYREFMDLVVQCDPVEASAQTVSGFYE